MGGAHRDPAAAIRAVGGAVSAAFGALRQMDREATRRHREAKFLTIGRLPG